MNDEQKLPGLTVLDLPEVGHRFLQRVYEHTMDATGQAQYRAAAYVALSTAPSLLKIVHDTEFGLGPIIESYDEMFMLPVGSYVIDEAGHVWQKMFQFDDPVVRGWICLSMPTVYDGDAPVMKPETAEFLTSQQGPLNFGFCLTIDAPPDARLEIRR